MSHDVNSCRQLLQCQFVQAGAAAWGMKMTQRLTALVSFYAYSTLLHCAFSFFLLLMACHCTNPHSLSHFALKSVGDVATGNREDLLN